MTTRRRKKHRPEEIVAKLRDAEAMLNAGKDLAVVLQALEVSESTYDRWRAQYGGMKCEEAKRLKQLEDENKRLKTLVAEFLPEALQPRVAALLADPRAEATATAWRMFLKSPVPAFGGRISGEFQTPPDEWLRPYLPNLAVIEVEADIVTDDPTAYDAIPCGAGLCVRREPALAYAQAAAADPRRHSLDRQGESTLSCGDWDMVLTAIDTGWSMGRFRRLHLTHVIPARRMDYAYNRKLAYGIGYSMGSPLEWRQPATAWQKFRRLARTAAAFLGLKGFGRHRGMDLSCHWGLLRGIVAAGSSDRRAA